MDIASVVSVRRNPPLRDFLLFGGVVVAWLALDMAVTGYFPERSFRLATTYALPWIALGGLVLLSRLGRQRNGQARRWPGLFGIVFVIAAAGTDLASTILVSPDLSLEANPYVRVLLDSGHSLRFVYLHMAITQAAYIAMFCGLWVTFLRHLPVLMETIAEARPTNRIEFLKAATGGSHLTTRQWLFPFRASELPLLYHCLWPLVVSIVFGISLFRCYAALEWMDVVEPAIEARAVVVAIGLVLALAVYFHVLWRIYGRQASPLAAATNDTRN